MIQSVKRTEAKYLHLANRREVPIPETGYISQTQIPNAQRDLFTYSKATGSKWRAEAIYYDLVHQPCKVRRTDPGEIATCQGWTF